MKLNQQDQEFLDHYFTELTISEKEKADIDVFKAKLITVLKEKESVAEKDLVKMGMSKGLAEELSGRYTLGYSDLECAKNIDKF